MIFQFANPQWLWLLLSLPLLFWLQGKQGKRAAIRFSSTQLAAQIAAFVRRRPGRWVISLRWLALALLLLALARPQTGDAIQRSSTSGVDIMIAIDLSTSMWAHDFELNGVPTDRMTAVRNVLERFIEARPNDRFGLIAFAAHPYLVSPLTLNHDWLSQRLRDLRIGQIEDGTAIGSAIGASVNRLIDSDAISRNVMLLTDGANNRGQIDPLVAAEAAQSLGIKVYTIGVGREGMAPFPARFDNNGQPLRNRDGSITMRQVPGDIDLDNLRQIAEMTGGAFFHADDTATLEAIYRQIDALEKTDIEVEIRYLFTDVFHIPMAAGMSLLFIEMLLSQTRRRRLPQ